MNKKPIVTKSGQTEELNATGAQVRFLCPAEATGKAWSLMEIAVPRDAGPPPHTHAWEEGYYIVDGEVSFTLGDQKILARTGDFVYVPGGVPHGFQGAADKMSRLIVFDAPAAAEDFFRDLDREVKNWPEDAPKALEIGARHKIQFLPPQ